jgi:multicomponent Na+:H+ antiporter subunit B
MKPPGGRLQWRVLAARTAEAVILLLVGVFLFLAVGSGDSGETPIRDYLVVHAARETGALNLVTSIYLGYRAYDTLGETIVLLLAVSGAVYFLERDK